MLEPRLILPVPMEAFISACAGNRMLSTSEFGQGWPTLVSSGSALMQPIIQRVAMKKMAMAATKAPNNSPSPISDL